MEKKFLFLTFLVFLQYNFLSAQRQWVLPTTTASEMKNPYTWYWPYAIAGAEAYRDFFVNAQQIHNQLYTQAKITGAFSQGNRPGKNTNGMMGGWSGAQGSGDQGGFYG